MPEHTKRSPLLPILLTLLVASRPAFRQARTWRRAGALVLGQLLSFGRHTITQTLVTLGLTTDDWSAFYRLLSVPRFAYDRLTRTLLEQTLTAAGTDCPYVVAVDTTTLPRQSRRMPGTGWLRAPGTAPFARGLRRAQRFLHLAWLVPRSVTGYSRAIPLRFVPAFPEKAVRAAGQAATKEWEAGLAELTWLRQQLDALGRRGQQVLGLADSSYETRELWRQLPERVVLLARTARNRALYALPPERSGQRGRPRTYGAQARHPADWLRERTGWRRRAVLVRGRTIPLTYRVEGPYLVRGAPERPLFLLVVKGIGRRSRRVRRREATFLVVTAVRDEAHAAWRLPLAAATLLDWAWQRWEIEVTHRELKTDLGVGEVQCWSRHAAVTAVQLQVWAASLLLLTGLRAWGLRPQPAQVPGRWWRGSGRWSVGQLLQALRQEVWGLPPFRPAWSGIGTNWEKIEQWLTLQTNATLGARRT